MKKLLSIMALAGIATFAPLTYAQTNGVVTRSGDVGMTQKENVNVQRAGEKSRGEVRQETKRTQLRGEMIRAGEGNIPSPGIDSHTQGVKQPHHSKHYKHHKKHHAMKDGHHADGAMHHHKDGAKHHPMRDGGPKDNMAPYHHMDKQGMTPPPAPRAPVRANGPDSLQPGSTDSVGTDLKNNQQQR